MLPAVVYLLMYLFYYIYTNRCICRSILFFSTSQLMNYIKKVVDKTHRVREREKVNDVIDDDDVISFFIHQLYSIKYYYCYQ